MKWTTRLAHSLTGTLGLNRSTPATGSTSPHSAPAKAPVIPSRAERIDVVSQDDAIGLSPTFRAINVIETAVMQLSVGVWRDDAPVDLPAFIRKPSLGGSASSQSGASAFYASTAVSLACAGNAYWLLNRPDAASDPLDMELLNPHEVSPRKDPGTGEITFIHKGVTYPEWRIKHLKFMRVPGHLEGLGPIQAARIEFRGALDARAYGALWFKESGIPNAILKTDQVLNEEQLRQYQNLWDGLNADGTERTDSARRTHRTRVLGQGLDYTPLALKPADAQFLETQQFTVAQQARLWGMTSSLMLIGVEGSSSTYANVEQEWIGFTRFTLMRYLREIEEALTDLLRGRQVARYKIDVLLRADTKTRYESYNLASWWMTDDEARALEGKAPLTDAQRATLTARNAPKEKTNAP